MSKERKVINSAFSSPSKSAVAIYHDRLALTILGAGFLCTHPQGWSTIGRAAHSCNSRETSYRSWCVDFLYVPVFSYINKDLYSPPYMLLSFPFEPRPAAWGSNWLIPAVHRELHLLLIQTQIVPGIALILKMRSNQSTEREANTLTTNYKWGSDRNTSWMSFVKHNNHNNQR